MKKIFSVVLMLMCISSFAQQTLYKTDHWADSKGKGGFVNAMENPTYEKVQVSKSSKNIKVTFGTKVYNYIIVSEKKFSDMQMMYSVTLNGKSFTISIANMPDGTTSIGIDGVWFIPDIKDISTIN